ncbi:MAG: DUF433 domain-containing protein [Chloroflexi bacterium]|nr:DUF433 domain-containing protein [Chloroflexota bacterium]
MTAVPVVEKYIEISPEIRFGKPCIAGTRIAVIDVAIWHNKLGMPLELIAAKWNLPLSGVYAAMAYYFEHREEIERRQAEDDALVEAAKQQQPPSKLQAILAERAAMDS